jgi:hypothetical protein
VITERRPEMAEEREKRIKAPEAAAAAAAEVDVEGHKMPRRDDAPTIEREKLPRAGDDEPDVEGHIKPR